MRQQQCAHKRVRQEGGRALDDEAPPPPFPVALMGTAAARHACRAHGRRKGRRRSVGVAGHLAAYRGGCLGRRGAGEVSDLGLPPWNRDEDNRLVQIYRPVAMRVPKG